MTSDNENPRKNVRVIARLAAAVLGAGVPISGAALDSKRPTKRTTGLFEVDEAYVAAMQAKQTARDKRHLEAAQAKQARKTARRERDNARCKAGQRRDRP